ncbi:hypothetical protein K466DRAFT_597159 [Polyporus arcularius HHB13444]|uniref:Uncharacterized protein n=1 Tax=Polyporus arcularius HHB13444 TaxID=1314778 RepID=A0A5C3PK77_9APHY|nr:hypothetical protein K466DRAFT_597159 [Polyporus arcularius HHB13444]
MPTYTYTARPAPPLPPRARGRNAFEFPRAAILAPVKRQGSDISRGSDSASSLKSRSDQTTRSSSPSRGSSTPPTSPASDALESELPALKCEGSPASDSADEEVFEDALSSPLESPSSNAADSSKTRVAPAPEIRTAALEAVDVPLPASPVDAGRNACQEPAPDSPMRMLSGVLLEENAYTHSVHSSPAADVPLPPSPMNAKRPSHHPREPTRYPPLPVSSSVSGTIRGRTRKRDSYYTRIHARPLPIPPRSHADPLASPQSSSTLTTGRLQQQSLTAPREQGDVLAETGAREVAVPVAHMAAPRSPTLDTRPSCIEVLVVVQQSGPADVVQRTYRAMLSAPCARARDTVKISMDDPLDEVKD